MTPTPEHTEVELFDIRYDQQHEAPVIFLKSKSQDLFLLIWIGDPEAISIDIAQSGRDPGRPLTHGLFINVLSDFEVEFIEVRIDRLVDSTYYAILKIKHFDAYLEYDARPSDAIAIALRAKIPVYVKLDLMYPIPIVKGDIKPEEEAQLTKEINELIDNFDAKEGQIDTAEFRNLIKKISPKDFKDS